MTRKTKEDYELEILALKEDMDSLQDENKRLREAFMELLEVVCTDQGKNYWLEKAGLNPNKD